MSLTDIQKSLKNRTSGAEEYNELNENAKQSINRLDQSEERICEVKDRSFEIIQSEEKKKKE